MTASPGFGRWTQGVSFVQTIHPHTDGVIQQSADISAAYQFRMQSLQLQMRQAFRRQHLLLFALAVLLLGGGIAIFQPWHIAAIVPGLAAALLLRRLFSLRKHLAAHSRLSEWYERGIARMNGEWQMRGSSGEEFARPGHSYSSDLNILGRGSIFELLATTRSAAGAERLAAFLLDPTDVRTVHHRQEAVHELRAATELRESLALVGPYAFQECNPRLLRRWLEAPVLRVARILPLCLLVLSVFSFALGILILIGVLPWLPALPFLLLPWFVQGIVGLALARRVRPVLESISQVASEVAVLKDGVALIEGRTFDSNALRSLADRLRAGDAAAHLRQLQRLVGACEQRRKDVFYQFSFFLGLGTQLALAIERWRSGHGADLAVWLDAWAEFEALNAIACYAYEHPRDVFPEIVEDATLFHAENLGHPLLPVRTCVVNDLHLDRESDFYLVSGSNMAGKSTWLRAIGVTAVLAAAGAPVRATRARLSLFAVCPSIGVGDSLADGKSKFLAEVERLQQTIHSAQQDRPVLFLIDEILSGTNAEDRRDIAESLLRTLLEAGAVGAISTHDQALLDSVEIGSVDITALRCVHVHMGSRSAEHPLDFDYRIKPGRNQQSNAQAISKMLGIATSP
jgi:MutS domain V